MPKIPRRLGELLVERGIITADQLEKALEVQASERKMLGEILVELGFITKEKLDYCLARQFGLLLGEILVRNKVITFEQLQEALERQREVNRPLGEVLIELGYVTEEQILRALSIRYGMRFIKLSEYDINVEAINKVPAEICKRYTILPVDIQGNFLVVATAEPQDVLAEQDIRAITGMDVNIVIASSEEIRSRLE